MGSNGALDPDELADVKLEVENRGSGTARDVTIHVRVEAPLELVAPEGAAATHVAPGEVLSVRARVRLPYTASSGQALKLWLDIAQRPPATADAILVPLVAGRRP
jgi:hypothetical protein